MGRSSQLAQASEDLVKPSKNPVKTETVVIMRINQYSDYALRTLIYLAVMPADQALANIQDIADSYSISKHHLVKIVHSLSRLGLVDTLRGKHGGIRLALPPDQINLGAVLRHTEADFAVVECFLSQTTAKQAVDGDRSANKIALYALSEPTGIDDVGTGATINWATGGVHGVRIHSEQWARSVHDLPRVSACVISPVCQLKPVFFEAIEAFLAVFDRYTLADVLHHPEQLRALLG